MFKINVMKNLSLFIFTMFLSVISYSQAPEKINYQAVVRDANGDIVSETNGPVVITISDGTNSYIESTGSNSLPTNKFGLINLVIGQGSITIVAPITVQCKWKHIMNGKIVL